MFRLRGVGVVVNVVFHQIQPRSWRGNSHQMGFALCELHSGLVVAVFVFRYVKMPLGICYGISIQGLLTKRRQMLYQTMLCTNRSTASRFHRTDCSPYLPARYRQVQDRDCCVLSQVSNRISFCSDCMSDLPHSHSTRKKIQIHRLSTSSPSIMKIPPSKSLK